MIESEKYCNCCKEITLHVDNFCVKCKTYNGNNNGKSIRRSTQKN